MAGAEISIVSKIGGSLLEDAVGNVGALALGQLLSITGIMHDDTAQKLDEILNKLNEIETEIKKLGDNMSTAISELKFDVAVKRAQKLIDGNSEISRLMTSLLVTSSEQLDAAKANISKRIEALLLNGEETWHSALVGPSGQTSIIKSWNQVVLAHAKGSGFFRPEDASAIQKTWERLDAQQALTVAYIVEYYRHNNMADAVPALYSTWLANRDTQLKMLRGVVDRQDLFQAGDHVTTTELNCWPPFAIFDFDTQLMWCQKISPPITRNMMSQRIEEFYAQYRSVQPNCETWTGVTSGWSLPFYDPFLHYGADVPSLKTLLQKCGATGMNHFVDSLNAHGFEFSSGGNTALWCAGDLSQSRDQPYGEWGSVKEGDGWTCPRYEPASIIALRHLDGGEADRYWYS